MPSHFRFAEHAPDPGLAPWIARYWEFEVLDGAPGVHHVPPDGCTSLLASAGPGIGDATLLATGPWLTPLDVPVQAGNIYRGIRLQPGAAESFADLAPESICNMTRPVQELHGLPGSMLARMMMDCANLAEAAEQLDRRFRARALHLERPDPLVTDIVAHAVLTRGRLRIAPVAAALGVSPRTLLRRFRKATGITPKQFARITRFRFAAFELAANERRLSSVAMASGYADQPHLNREWSELLGLTPGRVAELVRSTRHDNVVP
jgi:AraC-like DNA-binding protein